MNNYIAVVFASDDKAHSALRALWRMDEDAEITVHGAALVRRDNMGHIHVARRDSDLGSRTAAGVGIGALLGLLAGPIGVGAGVLAGGLIGATADAVTEDRRETAVYESLFALKPGQSAVVAEVSEDWTSVLNDAMKPLGGTIYRRRNNAETNAAFGPHYYNDYLYPYYYQPMYS